MIFAWSRPAAYSVSASRSALVDVSKYHQRQRLRKKILPEQEMEQGASLLPELQFQRRASFNHRRWLKKSFPATGLPGNSIGCKVRIVADPGQCSRQVLTVACARNRARCPRTILFCLQFPRAGRWQPDAVETSGLRRTSSQSKRKPGSMSRPLCGVQRSCRYAPASKLCPLKGVFAGKSLRRSSVRLLANN